MKKIPGLTTSVAAAICASFSFSPLPAVAGEPHELSTPERAEVARAVQSGLMDPSSAMFLWTTHTGDPVLYCGLVNAKNSFGGYVGFTPYMVFIVPNGGDIKAVLYKIGDGDIESPRTLGIAQTCWKSGYNFSTAKPVP